MGKNILDFTLKELEEQILELGEKKFRASQIFLQFHNKNIRNFDELKNIPKELAGKLKDSLSLEYLELIDVKNSSLDNTKKFLFQIPSTKDKIESVLISEKDRNTICVSTQAGCNAGCEFCATGKIGFKKNLSAGEILAQIYTVSEKIGEKPTNIVYMGMGEPFLNWEEVKKSVENLVNPKLFNFGSRSISISTVGVEGGIERFSAEFPQVNLAISLHFAVNEMRSCHMPANKAYDLEDIKKDLQDYFRKSKRKVFIEYIMFKGINDSVYDAEKLAEYLKSIGSSYLLHVNLISYNNPPSGGFGDFESSPKNKIEIFKNFLLQNKINATIRKSLGSEIAGACGQLAGK